MRRFLLTNVLLAGITILAWVSPASHMLSDREASQIVGGQVEVPPPPVPGLCVENRFALNRRLLVQLMNQSAMGR
jgi:hypothetical protein